MNKNDFEVYIFNEIITDPKYAGKNDYDLSIALAIPQPKVKRMRYEANLKYSRKNDEAYNQQFRELLIKAKPQAVNNGKAVKFCMEDKGLYLYIDNLLKKDGRFGDRSFNSELMVISTEDLAFLLEKTILTESEKQAILSKCQQLPDGKKMTLSEAILKIVEIFAKLAIKGLKGDWTGNLWDFALENIDNIIQWIIDNQLL